MSEKPIKKDHQLFKVITFSVIYGCMLILIYFKLKTDIKGEIEGYGNLISIVFGVSGGLLALIGLVTIFVSINSQHNIQKCRELLWSMKEISVLEKDPKELTKKLVQKMLMYSVIVTNKEEFTVKSIKISQSTILFVMASWGALLVFLSFSSLDLNGYLFVAILIILGIILLSQFHRMLDRISEITVAGKLPDVAQILNVEHKDNIKKIVIPVTSLEIFYMLNDHLYLDNVDEILERRYQDRLSYHKNRFSENIISFKYDYTIWGFNINLIQVSGYKYSKILDDFEEVFIENLGRDHYKKVVNYEEIIGKYVTLNNINELWEERHQIPFIELINKGESQSNFITNEGILEIPNVDYFIFQLLINTKEGLEGDYFYLNFTIPSGHFKEDKEFLNMVKRYYNLESDNVYKQLNRLFNVKGEIVDTNYNLTGTIDNELFCDHCNRQIIEKSEEMKNIFRQFYKEKKGSNPDKTINYYNNNASSFTSDTVSVDFDEKQNMLLKYLKPGAHILDLGCGSGRDSKAFIEEGYQVTAWDGSSEMCNLASQYIGQEVICKSFQELNDQNHYDAVWACASILHVPSIELPKMIEKIGAALKPGGYFYASFKYGDFEGEKNGRYFTNLTEESFESLLEPFQQLEVVEMSVTADVREGRQHEEWLNAVVKKKI